MQCNAKQSTEVSTSSKHRNTYSVLPHAYAVSPLAWATHMRNRMCNAMQYIRDSVVLGDRDGRRGGVASTPYNTNI